MCDAQIGDQIQDSRNDSTNFSEVNEPLETPQEQEDNILLQLVEEYGTKWSKISKILGGRSGHELKRRYEELNEIFDRTLVRQDHIKNSKICFKEDCDNTSCQKEFH